MMEDLRAQAQRCGAEIIGGQVSDIDLSVRPFKAVVDGGTHTVEADTVIISTGASAKYLGLPRRGKNTAEWASRLAPLATASSSATARGCRRRRRHSMRRSTLSRQPRLQGIYDCPQGLSPRLKVMQQRVFENSKIDVLFNTVTQSLFGNEMLEGARVATMTPAGVPDVYDIAVDGFFLAMSHKPNTDIFAGKIDLDEAGYIKVRHPPHRHFRARRLRCRRRRRPPNIVRPS